MTISSNDIEALRAEFASKNELACLDKDFEELLIRVCRVSSDLEKMLLKIDSLWSSRLYAELKREENEKAKT